MTESALPLSLEEVIVMLVNPEKPLQYSVLADLSGLDRDELKQFEQAWAKIGSERRREIVTKLVELGEDNAVLNFDDIFLSCLEDDDAEVRGQAVEGLWEYEEPSLIEPMVRLINEDTSEEVQESAVVALGKFAMLAELGKLRSRYANRVVDALVAVLEDKNKPMEVWRRALEAAAPLNLPRVKKAIDEAYQSDKYEFRISAIYAMGRNCDSVWLSLLLKELESPDTEMRYEAAGACGELGEEEAVPYLAKLVNDPDTDVQQAAIQALGKIGGSEARDILKQCLDASEEMVRELAEQALEELEFGADPLAFKFG